MSYNIFDTSISDASVIELYEFIIGVKSYRYASTESNVVYLGETFKGDNIQRSKIKQTKNLHKDGVTLKVPISFELSKIFLSPTIDDTINLKIFRGYSNDPANEFVAYWVGRVVGSTLSGSQIEVSCESIFTSVKRPGLRAKFEVGCRHAIYSSGCRASMSEFKVLSTITAVNGNRLTFTSPSMPPSDYFTGGIVETFDGSTRFIAKHTNDEIVLFQPMPSVIVTQSVFLAPGCNRSMDHCKNRFNNLDNFGGFPFIPVVNPFNPVSTW